MSEIGGMSKTSWIAVMDDLHELFLQGYGAGARGELVGLILLLVANSRATTSKKNLYFYMSDEVPLTLYLELQFSGMIIPVRHIIGLPEPSREPE